MAPNTVGWWRLVPHLTERDVVHDALVALDPLQLDGGDLQQDINIESAKSHKLTKLEKF
jgi:hypothetical protein